ncbi:MAG: alpha-galactosidase [Acutalibacteraceae bacterium]|nr:alpha-galactosidase [Acutalibacteraceae bacterium]
MYNFDFDIICKNDNCKVTLDQTVENGILFVNVNMEQNEKAVPEQFSVKWKISGADCCGVWNSFARNHTIRPDWGSVEAISRLASGMPIQQITTFDGNNKICVSLSDVDTPAKISMGYCEETAEILCEAVFFTLPTNAVDSYSAEIRIDMRAVPFYDSIYDTVEWWESECGYKSAFVPESARLPMDSLWYSFHQNLEKDKILEECRLSKELGMQTVIIDDGWQTDDNNRGYAYCGDWDVCENKMGDMAALVEEIHKVGQKVILWYSVPFVGLYSEKYEEFKDYLLDKSGNEKDFWALDPRYKKVREYLCEIYKKAITNWKLDGLKLDFIDSFVLKGKSLEYDERRDYQSLEDSIHALMAEIKAELTTINSDILIEFRQSYIGPSIRKYGNMLRVGDCPGDILANRSQIVNMRMTSGKTAVHSDMIMWNENDSVENAALQFANVIFSVPQISMLIKELPQEHTEMLRFYISFWMEYRHVLLDGKLTAKNPENDYSQASATLDNTTVTAIYTNNVVDAKSDKTVVVNASGFDSVIVKNAAEKSFTVKNCKGEIITTGTVKNSLEEIAVTKSGIVIIE